MYPITPVVPDLDLPITVFAKDQPQYKPLPSYVCEDGMVVTRWRANWKERIKILFGGSVWLSQLTFGEKLQPVLLQSSCPLKVSTGESE